MDFDVVKGSVVAFIIGIFLGLNGCLIFCDIVSADISYCSNCETYVSGDNISYCEDCGAKMGRLTNRARKKRR